MLIIVTKEKVNPAPRPIKTPIKFILSTATEPPVAAKKHPPMLRNKAMILTGVNNSL